MQKHADIGAQIANKIPNISADPLYVKMSCDICKYHHERYDGNGYPEGLRGDEIPFCAQIVAIADVYDALTSERVYKPAYSHQTAVRMILDGECGVFSDRLLTAFQNAVGGGIYSYEMSMELTFIPGFVK